jgi:hypothetical protein
MKIILKGSGEFEVKLSRVEERLLTKKTTGLMAAAAIGKIIDRTLDKNIDKKGTPFEKYSDAYSSKKRQRAGFKDRHISARPDLFNQGHMLGDLTFSMEGDKRAFLHFPKTQENLKASGHIHGSRRLPKRDFFGLMTSEEKELLFIPKRHLEKIIKEANK